MSDEQLQSFIPKFGDRIAVKQFLEKEAMSNVRISSFEKKMKEKFQNRNLESANSKKIKLVGNQNAKKDERRYELGWKHCSNSKHKQYFKYMRETYGGGTRHLTAPNSMTVAEMRDIAFKLFFPDGVDDALEFTMKDFAGKDLEDASTLKELYDKQCVKIVRVYIYSKTRDCYSKIGDSKIRAKSNDMLQDEPDQLPDLTLRDSDGDSKIGNSKIRAKSNDMLQDEPDLNPRDSDCDSKIGNSKIRAKSNDMLQDEPAQLPDLNLSDNDFQAEEDMLQMAIRESSLYLDESIEFGKKDDAFEDLDVTLPIITSLRKQEIRIHRGHAFNEMNENVKAGIIKPEITNYKVTMVLPNGKEEEGEDDGGVFRDCLTEYWETFYQKATCGRVFRVPVIRHDMKDTWSLVAVVIVVGLKVAKYFPVRLAPPFLHHVLGHSVKDEYLLKYYKDFLPEGEKEISENPDFEDDEFLDFLTNHDVKTVVKPSNWLKILIEIAHKELIQMPAHVANCWAVIFSKYIAFMPKDIDETFRKLIPKPRNVISLLNFSNDCDGGSAEFLKKFIRKSEADLLRRFLRFCTGADIIICDSIEVQFVKPQTDFGRCPVAHTCGCLLELPSNYNSELELTVEFESVLKSDIWCMDFI